MFISETYLKNNSYGIFKSEFEAESFIKNRFNVKNEFPIKNLSNNLSNYQDFYGNIIICEKINNNYHVIGFLNDDQNEIPSQYGKTLKEVLSKINIGSYLSEDKKVLFDQFGNLIIIHEV